MHGFSISISPQVQWPLESCEFCPPNSSGTSFLLSAAVLAFIVSCLDHCHSFLPGSSAPGLALWPACPPHCYRVLFLNHRYCGVSHRFKILHWVFPALKRKSIFASMVFKVFVISWISLHNLCLPPNLMFILYSWHSDWLSPELATFPWNGYLCLERPSLVASSLCTPPPFIPLSCPPTWLTFTHPLRCNLSTTFTWKLPKTHPLDFGPSVAFLSAPSDR